MSIARFLPLILLGGGALLIYMSFRRRRIDHDADRHPDDREPPSGPAGGSRSRPRASELYRLARSKGGVLTVSDVVVELDVEPEDAEAALEAVTDGQRVQMEVDPDGRITYRFVEIAPGE